MRQSQGKITSFPKYRLFIWHYSHDLNPLYTKLSYNQRRSIMPKKMIPPFEKLSKEIIMDIIQNLNGHSSNRQILGRLNYAIKYAQVKIHVIRRHRVDTMCLNLSRIKYYFERALTRF
jgi:hypothetical protein